MACILWSSPIKGDESALEQAWCSSPCKSLLMVSTHAEPVLLGLQRLTLEAVQDQVCEASKPDGAITLVEQINAGQA